MTQKATEKPIIIALDFSDPLEAINFAEKLDSSLCRLKVGKELFTAAGPSIVERLHHLGFEIFLDLKFHDIPKTVAGAIWQAASLGVWMVDVHAQGGAKMLMAARDAIRNFKKPPLLIGVTLLTSFEQETLHQIGIRQSIRDQVLNLTELCLDSGLDGVVCSARESCTIRESFGEDLIIVSPGIRLEMQPHDDQRRVVSPLEAIRFGVNYVVMGRALRQTNKPGALLEEINEALSSQKARQADE